MPAAYTVRRSIALSPPMHARLRQLASQQDREVTEADLIRQAIREFLDRQEGIAGSRAHFGRSLQTRLDTLDERRDGQTRFASSQTREPLVLERGIHLDLTPVAPPAPAGPVYPGTDRALLERAHRRLVARLERHTPGASLPFTDLARQRESRRERIESREREA